MRVRSLGVLGACGVAVALAMPTAASAANTCGFSTDTVTIHLNDGGPTQVSRDGDAIQFNGANCGAATVLNTEQINVDDSGSNADFFKINLGGGFFGDDSLLVDEIQWGITLDDGLTNQLEIDAAVGGSTISAGSDGINLNAQESDLFDDIEVRNLADTGPPVLKGIVFEGGNGPDVFKADGSDGTGNPWPDTGLIPAIDFTDPGGAANEFVGGDGDDIYEDENGADDVFDGGDGTDTIRASNVFSPLKLDLSNPGPQDTGSVGTDTFHLVEDIAGGHKADELTGTSGVNVIDGGDGGDVIRGGFGDDVLIASDTAGTHQGDTLAYDQLSSASGVVVNLQADFVDGGQGEDDLTQSFGEFDNVIGSNLADVITGSDSANVLTGGGGSDTIFALSGADTLAVRDGVGDSADCGADSDPDTVEADTQGLDTLTNCGGAGDAVAFPPAVVPPPGPSPAPKKCKKGKKLKKGKCVKKKKKKRKHKR